MAIITSLGVIEQEQLEGIACESVAVWDLSAVSNIAPNSASVRTLGRLSNSSENDGTFVRTPDASKWRSSDQVKGVIGTLIFSLILGSGLWYTSGEPDGSVPHSADAAVVAAP